jgi:hypothetical protein
MSRSRMFDDDEGAEATSPRTTIVGGRPPEDQASTAPLPTGIQRLLRLASVDQAFARELCARRDGMASVAAVELNASERAILRAIPEAQLASMIATLPPPAPDRRDFLRESAASAVVLLGGAALTACDRVQRSLMPTCGGAAPHVPPPRPADEADTGAEPRVQQGVTASGGGAAPDVPLRPRRNEMQNEGGIAPRLDVPERPEHNEMQRKGGAAPDTDSDGGRPRPSPTRGIRPDIPRRRRDGGSEE